MRKRTSPRIASVCVLGKRVHQLKSNPHRIKLMQAILDRLAEAAAWASLDAIVFPGAFFRQKALIGPMSWDDRSAAIMKEDFGKASAELSSRLTDLVAGAHLIFGADSVDPKGFEFGDQLCISMSAGQITGIARKIFPTEEDTNGWTKPYVPYLADFDSEQRLIDLPSGHRALLNNCYDIFALAKGKDGLPRGARSIRDLWRDGEYHVVEKPGFAEQRTEAVNRWLAFRKSQKFDVAISTIHAFRKPGTEVYWSRHGIAAASAAMNGGFAIGAAHFIEGLPGADRATLAACGVKASEAKTGAKRKSSSLTPVEHFEVKVGDLKGLVRLFEPSAAGKPGTSKKGARS